MPGWVLAVETIVPLVYIALAMLIYWRKPKDRVAVFVATTLVSFVAFLDPIFDSPSPTDSSWYLPSMAVQAIGWVTAISFYLVFPNGRFVPRWSRFLVPALVVSALIWVLFPDSPFNLSHLYSLPLPVFAVDMVPWIVGAVAQAHRFARVSRPVERQQTKLALFGITITFLAYFTFAFDRFATPVLARPSFAGVVYDLIGVPVFLMISLLVPASLAVSIFRYRLWDIDVLIGRTLVYGSLTAILAGLYTASIGLSQRLFVAFTGSKSDAAIVFTTLIVASAFTPVKTALQSVVDRRFKLRADPFTGVNAFRDRVRAFAELVDAERLLSQALEEAAKAFGATGGAVYLRKSGRAQHVLTYGDWNQTEGMSAWLDCDGPSRGRVVLGPRRSGREYGDEDRRIFADLVALVGHTIRLVERPGGSADGPSLEPESSPTRGRRGPADGAQGELMI